MKKHIRAEIQEQQACTERSECEEGTDWAYLAISAAVIVTLVLLAVVAHAWVSSGI